MQNRAASENTPQGEAVAPQVTEPSVYQTPGFAPRISAEDAAGWNGIAEASAPREQAEIERLRGLVLEVLDYWNSGNWRILYVENMRGWRKRALDTLGPIAQEEAAKAAACRIGQLSPSGVVVEVPIPQVRV